jgi:hypothetical protein
MTISSDLEITLGLRIEEQRQLQAVAFGQEYPVNESVLHSLAKRGLIRFDHTVAVPTKAGRYVAGLIKQSERSASYPQPRSASIARSLQEMSRRKA